MTLVFHNLLHPLNDVINVLNLEKLLNLEKVLKKLSTPTVYLNRYKARMRTDGEIF